MNPEAPALFDTFSRTHCGPSAYAEPTFQYWNRTSRQDISRVRVELERWFARYPSDHALDLRARFRSNNDVHHRAAFFELFLHEMLVRLGCMIVVHPEVPGSTRHPEFRVTCPDGHAFYLEAKVAADESEEQAGERVRLNQVYDAINDLNSPDFWINVALRARPTSLVRTKALKQFLAEKVALLDYETVARAYDESGLDGVPTWAYESEGWQADLSVIPKGKTRGQTGVRPLGLQMSPGHWLDSVTALRSSILAKAKRYGALDLPYVVAINYLGEHVDEIDEVSALFGDEEWVIPAIGSQLRFRRQPNGVWTRASGRYRRLSAVLMFRHLEKWNFPKTVVHLYHHPDPAKKLEGVLTVLPQVRVNDERLEVVPGASLGDVLGIDADWLREASHD